MAQINPTIGDFPGNQRKILSAIAYGKSKGCNLILFSELALTGYPPEDFLLLPEFVQKAEEALPPIIEASQGIAIILGTIRRNKAPGEMPLFNSAAICFDQKLIGYQDKTHLPTYDVFDERRYFEPAKSNISWTIGAHTIGVTICEDIWQQSAPYLQDPITELSKYALDAAVNLSASPFHVDKIHTRLEVCQKVIQSLHCPLYFCNQVGGNDSLIFDGYSLAFNQEGTLTHIAKGFQEDYLIVNSTNTSSIVLKESLRDLYDALILGVRDYFHKSGFKKACLGLSGGIDSALVACLATEALGAENILGIAMPSRYSSPSSLKDAQDLAKNLNIAVRHIPIEEPFQSYLDLLAPEFKDLPADTTEENLQARIRGMILMAISNKLGYIVLSTGNKSELALGYSTLYGDMCGGLAVISDLTKEQVYALSHWINREREIIPNSTLTKPPSAELRPNQKDSDSLPPYSIVDTILKDYIEEGKSPEAIAQSYGFDLKLVEELVQRIHKNEYKRRQSPPGLRVSEKAFSVGRRFPIVQKWV